MSVFDSAPTSYEREIEAAVVLSRQEHAFFVEVKADALLRLIRQKLAVAPADVDVLDLGCGSGSSHPFLSTEVRALHGIDVSEAMVKHAHVAHPEVRHCRFDGKQLPYRSGSFDVVVAVCVFHHVDPDEREGLVAEARRVLRSGGLLVVAEHNPFNPLTRLIVRRCCFDADAILLSSSATSKLLRGGGLEDVRSQFTLLFPWRGTWFRAVERAAELFPIGAQYLTFGTNPG